MNEADTVRRRAIARGTVQGVFFRESIRSWAVRHGLSGWVRNRPDGALEAVLEGDRQDVEAVLAEIEQGPPAARVDELEVTAEQPTGLEGFDVR